MRRWDLKRVVEGPGFGMLHRSAIVRMEGKQENKNKNKKG
jgi:hypothetical protein